MKDDNSLRKQYKSDFRDAKRIIAPLTAVEHRLGSFDAIKEWQNQEEACAKFLNTRAYKRFIKDEYIVLIGRTGTGKTSILKKLQYDIENGIKKDEIRFNYLADDGVQLQRRRCSV